MKARVQNGVPPKVNKSNVTVSIGMIVKNEEKHLDNCLSALQKLRDSVSSELIIVDTGSTDNTKEIAKKYTDKVYDFEWIDDFAAARNFGLEKAIGEWFMFLDADEYMDEDCGELIRFFNDRSINSNCNTATYIVRNYFSRQRNDYSDFTALRIVRRRDDLRFKGFIHEYLNWRNPIHAISVPFHHYGYLNDQDENKYEEKVKRNKPLLQKEFEENPEDAQLVCSIIDVCTEKEEEQEWINVLKELIKLPYNKDVINAAYMKIFRFYLKYRMFSDIHEAVEQFMAIENNENNACVLYAYIAEAQAYEFTGEKEKALSGFESYFAAYNRFKKGELDNRDLIRLPIYGSSESDYLTILFKYTDICLSIQQYKKAVSALNAAGFDLINKHGDDLQKYITLYINSAVGASDLSLLRPLLEKTDSLSEESKELLINDLSAAYIRKNDFASEKLKPVETFPMIYAHLNAIAGFHEGRDISDSLMTLADAGKIINVQIPELLYICIKTGFDLSDSLGKARLHDVTAVCAVISREHDDLAADLNSYLKVMPFDASIKTLLFFVNAFTGSVLKLSDADDNVKKEIYDNYVNILADYVLNIYNPELLNPEDIVVLPELHQFGYYMAVALSAQSNGRSLEYVRALRKALTCCKTMKPIVEYYIENIKL